MHPRSPILLLKLAIMNKAFQCGGFWAKALFILFVELMEGGNVNEAYQEIMKCHDVSDYRLKSYMLHISEVRSLRQIELFSIVNEILTFNLFVLVVRQSGSI